jgi:homoserine dehydrogenase
MKKIKIGLFGFGVVGEGIYQVLNQKPGLGAEIRKIVIKHPEKRRNAPSSLFSTDARDILEDEEIDLVVELIDDAEAAFRIVTVAMDRGKSVVSANKKMIAENHAALIALSLEKGVSFLYEASVCGSIPIIRNLEEYFDNDLLTHIRGIINGSTNYILSKMYLENTKYEDALASAQLNGYAESDPSLDVEGIDAANKLSIITLHAFGKFVDPASIIRKGITSLHPHDFQYAREKGMVIKLVAKCLVNGNGQPATLSVMPTFVKQENALGMTNNEYNGVLVGSTLADEQFFQGKGAGRYPTSSAVLSDISAYRYGYKYEYKKGHEDYQVSNKITQKFYLSFPRNNSFDLSFLDNIEEQFIGKEREYVIGTAAYDRLRSANLLNNNEISLVSFN